MDEDRRKSIRDAPREYRDRVEPLNFSLLRAAIDQTNGLPVPDGRIEREAITQKRRVSQIATKCPGHWDGREYHHWTSPEQYLSDDLRKTLVRRYGLDGVHDRDLPDIEKGEAWFAHIEDAVAALDIDSHLPPSDSLPEDPVFLCSLMDGKCGPGLRR